MSAASKFIQSMMNQERKR